MAREKSEIHPVDRHVGARIREARLLRRLSQQALGDAISPPITFQQIQKYEKGANRVSSSKLWEIARVLDVDITFFFEGHNEDGENRALANRPTSDDIYFTSDEIELVRIYRGAGGTEVKAKMRDLLKAVASQLS